jgi:tetratricopeptide (TPR) repeat protein
LLAQAIALLDANLGSFHARSWVHHDTRAEIALLQQRHIDAERALKPLLAAIPANASTLRQRLTTTRKLAMAQRGLGDFTTALATAEQSRSLAETENQVRDQAANELLIALLQLDLNQPELAATHFARALELDSRCVDQACVLDQASMHFTRAHYLARSGQNQAALTALRVALNHRDWSADLLDHADLKSLHGDPEWAVLNADLAQRLGRFAAHLGK